MNTNVIIGSIAIIIIVGGLLYFGSRDTGNNTQNTPSPTQEEQLPNETSSPNPTPTKFPTFMRSNGNITPLMQDVTATLKTNKGDIVVTLYGSAAPTTVGNFVQLAERDFYDGTMFHRVISDFMIQGGDPHSKDPATQGMVGSGGPGYTFEDEINDRKLVRGSLAMANSGPNTNGSQFFIVTAEETPWLDGLHTNFGEVVSGMEVVEAIEAVETGPGDQPIEPIVLEDVILQQ
ncbi:MAG: peptidylprolyl isomerase [Candidatus Andersenbacteria bacterium]